MTNFVKFSELDDTQLLAVFPSERCARMDIITKKDLYEQVRNDRELEVSKIRVYLAYDRFRKNIDIL